MRQILFIEIFTRITCWYLAYPFNIQYIARNKGFQDATNTVFSYAIADNGLNYILKGNDAEGKEVVSDGSKQS